MGKKRSWYHDVLATVEAKAFWLKLDKQGQIKYLVSIADYNGIKVITDIIIRSATFITITRVGKIAPIISVGNEWKHSKSNWYSILPNPIIN